MRATTRAALLGGIAFSVATVAAASGAADLPDAVSDSDYKVHPPAQVKLGQLLFYDRVLSGTRRVSCATCHSPDRASSNGFRPDRKPDDEGDELAINGLPLYEALKPSAKHAPHLFNLGAEEFRVMFSDGRVAQRLDGTFDTPAGDELPAGLNDVLAAQALFPAVTEDELVGTVDSEVRAASHLGNAAVWEALVARVIDRDDYWPAFKGAYPQLNSVTEVDITHIANAISAFVGTEWRSDQSPFDAYLRGDLAALTADQQAGMKLFYGKANCSACHSGKFQTDHRFYAVATPLWRFDVDFQAEEFDLHQTRDALTGKAEDKHRRRTPSLRNIQWTAPYGHAGSFETLEEMVKAHLAPQQGLQEFVARRLDSAAAPDQVQASIAELNEANELSPVVLTETEFSQLISFLKSLSEPQSLGGKLGRPEVVPSFLALD